MSWGRCHEPCPSAIPNTEHPRPIHWPPSLDPMLPQQWSNPDYCYLEPASRVKPEQLHQMAVSTNHNLGGCVIQLISLLSDVKNYRGFQGYSPFHLWDKVQLLGLAILLIWPKPSAYMHLLLCTLFFLYKHALCIVPTKIQSHYLVLIIIKYSQHCSI